MQPNPANDDRPASFDAQLVESMPFLRQRAWRLVNRNDVEDLVQLTLAYAMRSWKTLSERYTFQIWLYYQLRAAARDMRAQYKAPSHSSEDFFEFDHSLERGGEELVELIIMPANQDSIVELSQVCDALQGRAGEIVWRVAQGEELSEVGQTMGITKQRAHVLAKQERERLAKRLNTNRSMRIAA